MRIIEFPIICYSVILGLASVVRAADSDPAIVESAYDIAAIDRANAEYLRPLLHDIVTTTDFFRYYRLDLFGRPCLFWDDEGMCGNRACAVDTIDDETHLPEIWRSDYLGRLSTGSTFDYDDDLGEAFGDEGLGSCVTDLDPPLSNAPLDYCDPEEVSGEGPGVYVSLLDNPERYTGYLGPHANMIWNAIYNENCFAGSIPSTHSTGNELIAGPVCVEKQLFYKVVSGMHASVSTHLCNEFLDTETGEWGPNLDLFMEKVGNYPERISNVYFNFALVAKAVSNLRHYLEDFTFCTNAQGYDTETRRKMLKIAIEADRRVPELFDTSSLFRNDPQLKEEFRNKFVNVTRIIDCTGCDKCRLWGKLQVTGYATALKILFDLPESSKSGHTIELRRMEMVALINTFDRLSKSVQSIGMFHDMLNPQDKSAISDTLYIDEEESPIIIPRTKHSDWDPEWARVWHALKFILRSYVDFPKNLVRAFVYHGSKWWTTFVGRDIVLERQRLEQVVISRPEDEL
ncbi:endoplasmic reticulum Oxidoreductin 1-domain-containing protein [Lipomyces oligophaga]|uniref:endoplasmic reticulum Oxidoreductin 1-domain-containing protein n=1 Tax=Lipomyces oligophaga TaxID=45792 RepID=UPI0034CE18C1